MRGGSAFCTGAIAVGTTIIQHDIHQQDVRRRPPPVSHIRFKLFAARKAGNGKLGSTLMLVEQLGDCIRLISVIFDYQNPVHATSPRAFRSSAPQPTIWQTLNYGGIITCNVHVKQPKGCVRVAR